MSTHSVNVIEIQSVLPHPNADRLEIVPVGGWQAVVKKDQFRAGDRAVYIQPDYTVPTARPEFAFLAREGRDRHRLKAVRLRGALSFGLLIPVPDDVADADVGSCVMERLDIARYEPPVKAFKGGGDGHDLPDAEWPTVYAPKFDIENIQNFPDLISTHDAVVVTEKLHGANARYLYHKGTFYLGSRTRWLRPDADNIWSRAVTRNIRAWCEANEDVTLFGEIFGPVQSLKYGQSDPRFAAFAALDRELWWPLLPLFEGLNDYGVPHVPLLYRGLFDFEVVKTLAEQDSIIGGPGHLMEGVVIVPMVERRDPDIGRVALKYISNRYWESEA